MLLKAPFALIRVWMSKEWSGLCLGRGPAASRLCPPQVLSRGMTITVKGYTWVLKTSHHVAGLACIVNGHCRTADLATVVGGSCDDPRVPLRAGH